MKEYINFKNQSNPLTNNGKFWKWRRNIIEERAVQIWYDKRKGPKGQLKGSWCPPPRPLIKANISINQDPLAEESSQYNRLCRICTLAWIIKQLHARQNNSDLQLKEQLSTKKKRAYIPKHSTFLIILAFLPSFYLRIITF